MIKLYGEKLIDGLCYKDERTNSIRLKYHRAKPSPEIIQQLNAFFRKENIAAIAKAHFQPHPYKRNVYHSSVIVHVNK
jgi:hypothetical protein